MKLVTSNESTSTFADTVSKLVEDAKHNTQWRKQFMDFKHYMSQSFREGKEEGAAEKAMEAARSFFANGVSVELIAKSLGMTEEQVREIVKEPVPVKNSAS